MLGGESTEEGPPAAKPLFLLSKLCCRAFLGGHYAPQERTSIVFFFTVISWVAGCWSVTTVQAPVNAFRSERMVQNLHGRGIVLEGQRLAALAQM